MTRETVLAAILAVMLAAIIAYLLHEQRRHHRHLDDIGTRILVNGIRGKSSVTRLIAGALRADPHRTVVAKTTGTAARFIYPGGREAPIDRGRSGIVNVIEQLAVIARAHKLGADTAVVECMAVQPDLQQLNQEKFIRSQIGVITNVRADHLEEMGGPDRTLDQVAISLCRGMPTAGVCVTAETDRWDLLAAEAARRGTRLVYADPGTVTDVELGHFGWITFKENVAVALAVAELCGVPRQVALAGMYAADPDPGVLRVDPCRHNGRRFAAVNLFAANDPTSTLMNVTLLRDRNLIGPHVSVVINCRPDRAERNGQMGALTADLDAARIFLIGAPTSSALGHIPTDLRDRVVDLGGEHHTGTDLLEAITGHLDDDPHHAVVMIGNIHGRGEHLLEALNGAGTDPTLDEELAELTDADTHVYKLADMPTAVLNYR